MDVAKDREPADMPGWELHLRERAANRSPEWFAFQVRIGASA
jgi:hypothetical protein